MPTVNTVLLTEFSDRENARTWVLNAHSMVKPSLCIQKRRIPNASSNPVISSDLKLVKGTEDALGVPMAKKISIECIPTIPVGALEADVDAVIADFRNIVQSTAFEDVVKQQLYLSDSAAAV